MKKLFNILFSIIIFGTSTMVQAKATDWNTTKNVQRVNNVGTKILNENKLPRGIVFRVSNEDTVNAYANINKEVYVYAGLLNYVETDEELAAVISHEIGHILNGHCAKQTLLNAGINSLANTAAQNTSTAGILALATGKQLATTKISRTDEFEADLTGVDLLVNAGYNPLSLISLLNKITGNYVDVFQTHPSGEKRLMNIYDYISYNYPTYIKKGYNTSSYTNALVFIDANVKERKDNPKLMKKYEKEQAKLKKDKIKRAKKMNRSVNGWDASYTVLNLMAS